MPQIIASFPSMISYKGRMIRAVRVRGIVRARGTVHPARGEPESRRAANSHTESCAGRQGFFCKQCGLRTDAPEDLRAHYLKKHPLALTDAGGERLPGDPNPPKGAREPCPRCGKMVGSNFLRVHKCKPPAAQGAVVRSV